MTDAEAAAIDKSPSGAYWRQKNKQAQPLALQQKVEDRERDAAALRQSAADVRVLAVETTP